MASTYKGRHTKLFPPLHRPDHSLVDDPAQKVQLFKEKFFPTALTAVGLCQPNNPPDCMIRTWDAIITDEVTAALKTTTNKSAPGPSRVGYKILKWAHATRPNLLTYIFNLSLESGTHPWKTAIVVVLNKPNKLDYSVLKAY